MEQKSNPREGKKKSEESQIMRDEVVGSTSNRRHAHDAHVHTWDDHDHDHHAHDDHDGDDDVHGHADGDVDDDDGDGGRRRGGGRWGKGGCVCVSEEDFDEVEGCIDLGFSFPPGHMQRLRGVLPALDACYAVVTHNPDSILRSPAEGSTTPQSPISPATSPPTPDEMRVKLRHWARAVACTVRQSQ